MLRPLGCLAYLGLFLSECLAATDIRTVYVKTVDGTLRGYASTVLQKPIVTFLGIPFATPPVKDLRFKPPIPLKPWKGIRDATKPAPTCIQPLPEKCKLGDSNVLQQLIVINLIRPGFNEKLCIDRNREFP
ncbi:Acetylcholinesterase [Echinococcus granulosus]|uniref:Acetylcholinesterase n=1 Tax=Echinococcus granulosus TaxID=6210 RepID=W6UHU3_ECHGR|nr:Acetylcholinesterase [Echinococcus granulosus]EUB57667.1 Acetylcholinesterase [Echinococcus granulosus]